MNGWTEEDWMFLAAKNEAVIEAFREMLMAGGVDKGLIRAVEEEAIQIGERKHNLKNLQNHLLNDSGKRDL